MARTSARTQRIRIWLSKQSGSFTSRDILHAVDPNAHINNVSAAIDHLVKRGDILRKQVGGVQRYKLSEQGLKAANDDPSLNRMPARRKPPAAAKAACARTQNPKPAPPPPQASMRAMVDASVRTAAQRAAAQDKAAPVKAAAPREARNRVPPIACSMSGVPDAKRSASDRIARDIDAFLSTGGVIERLGVTKLFHHPADNDDE